MGSQWHQIRIIVPLLTIQQSTTCSVRFTNNDKQV